MHRSTRFIFAFLLVAAVALASCSQEQYQSWTTDSGLQISEVRVGSGDLGKKGDVLRVTYTASYTNGDLISSQQDPERPLGLRLGAGGVLPGIEEGAATMRPGGKRILVLPPHLAFEAEGERPSIVPEGAWVRVEIELLSIEPGPPTPQPWSDVGYDIVATDTGLQYVDFEEGEGDYPRLGCIVTVRYTGYLDDGSVFDSTDYRGRPIAFELTTRELILGWLEGLATMRPGGRRKLIIPPELAYGEKGVAKQVPPNATITYDVKLIAVECDPPSDANDDVNRGS